MREVRAAFRRWYSRSPGYVRPWYRRAVHLVVVSPVLLWTLLRLRRHLRRGGLRGAVEAATPANRRFLSYSSYLSEAEQRMQACYEDDVISWWLVNLRIRSICLYQSLVMLDRLSRLPYIETLELVMSVHRMSNGLDGHAWIVANGKPFRDYQSIHPRAVVVCRIPRLLTPATDPSAA